MSPTYRDGEFHGGMFPESSTDRLKQALTETWNQLDLEQDFGAADRGVIESLREKVTEALAKTPPDIERANSLTAEVFLRIQSNTDC